MPIWEIHWNLLQKDYAIYKKSGGHTQWEIHSIVPVDEICKIDDVTDLPVKIDFEDVVIKGDE